MYPIIHIWKFSIYTYTLAGLIGVFFGVIAAVYCDPRNKKIRPDIFYCALYCMIGGFLGGKILYILTILPDIIRTPSLLLNAVSSGMVFYGGLIGGIFGGYVYIRQYKVNFFRIADCMAVGLPVGHFFGRLGCFAAGCCYGKPYNGIFSVIYPECSLSAPPGISVHPVPLYEGAFNLLLFLFLLIMKRKNNTNGVVFYSYLVLYGIARIFFEMLRYDFERGFIGGLSVSQFISIFIILAGLAGFIYTKLRKNMNE